MCHRLTSLNHQGFIRQMVLSVPSVPCLPLQDGHGVQTECSRSVPIPATLTQAPLNVSLQGLHHALLPEQWHQFRGWLRHLLSPGLHGI